MALLLILSGLVFLLLRPQQAAARQERVKRGELSDAEARKRNRTQSWVGYALIAIGLGLLLAHFVGI